MSDFAAYAMQWYKVMRRTSTFYARTALKQGGSLDALRALADLYVQLKLAGEEEPAGECLSAMGSHLAVCSVPGIILPPYVVPKHVDRRAYAASAGQSPEWLASSLTRYNLLRYSCLKEWFARGAFSPDMANDAIVVRTAVYDVQGDLKCDTLAQNVESWQFVRLLVQAGQWRKARDYCLGFWPVEGTWRLRGLGDADFTMVQTRVLRLLVHGMSVGGAQVCTEMLDRLNELVALSGDRGDLNDSGLCDYSCRLEYCHIRNQLQHRSANFSVLIDDLRGLEATR